MAGLLLDDDKFGNSALKTKLLKFLMGVTYEGDERLKMVALIELSYIAKYDFMLDIIKKFNYE